MKRIAAITLMLGFTLVALNASAASRDWVARHRISSIDSHGWSRCNRRIYYEYDCDGIYDECWEYVTLQDPDWRFDDIVMVQLTFDSSGIWSSNIDGDFAHPTIPDVWQPDNVEYDWDPGNQCLVYYIRKGWSNPGADYSGAKYYGRFIYDFGGTTPGSPDIEIRYSIFNPAPVGH